MNDSLIVDEVSIRSVLRYMSNHPYTNIKAQQNKYRDNEIKRMMRRWHSILLPDEMMFEHRKQPDDNDIEMELEEIKTYCSKSI
jgi:hypothetical protein